MKELKDDVDVVGPEGTALLLSVLKSISARDQKPVGFEECLTEICHFYLTRHGKKVGANHIPLRRLIPGNRIITIILGSKKYKSERLALFGLDPSTLQKDLLENSN